MVLALVVVLLLGSLAYGQEGKRIYFSVGGSFPAETTTFSLRTGFIKDKLGGELCLKGEPEFVRTSILGGITFWPFSPIMVTAQVGYGKRPIGQDQTNPFVILETRGVELGGCINIVIPDIIKVARAFAFVGYSAIIDKTQEKAYSEFSVGIGTLFPIK